MAILHVGVGGRFCISAGWAWKGNVFQGKHFIVLEADKEKRMQHLFVSVSVRS